MSNYIDERLLVKELSDYEIDFIQKIITMPDWLNYREQSIVRWALSLARISKIKIQKNHFTQTIFIDHATDLYRKKLYNILTQPLNNFSIDKIFNLIKSEEEELLSLYQNRLTKNDFYKAIESRPLALVLSGGGGSSYVFAGALDLFAKSGIKPNIIAGASMGAILGAIWAKEGSFDLYYVKKLIETASIKNVIKPTTSISKYTLPATLSLRLRFPELFNADYNLRLNELKIPLIVAVGGLVHIEGQKDLTLEEYEDLSRSVLHGLKINNDKNFISAISQVLRKPIKAIYLGSDTESQQIELINALGLTAAIPGVFQYNISKNHTQTLALLKKIMIKENILRFIDGGFIDNLPSEQALICIQENSIAVDPFVVALDGFTSSLNQNIFYYPMLRFALKTSVGGKKHANLTIHFDQSLSPLNIFPSIKAFEQISDIGRIKAQMHLALIKKLLEPIAHPPFGG
jgi:predicted acylesterase/phospholipase RssA